jgi:hypothetical protein
MLMVIGARIKVAGVEALVEVVVVLLPLEGVVGVLAWAGQVLAQLGMGPRSVNYLRRS